MFSIVQTIRDFGQKTELSISNIMFLIAPLRVGFEVEPRSAESLVQIRDTVHEVLSARRDEVIETLKELYWWKAPEGMNDLETIAAMSQAKESAAKALEYLNVPMEVREVCNEDDLGCLLKLQQYR